MIILFVFLFLRTLSKHVEKEKNGYRVILNHAKQKESEQVYYCDERLASRKRLSKSLSMPFRVPGGGGPHGSSRLSRAEGAGAV